MSASEKTELYRKYNMQLSNLSKIKENYEHHIEIASENLDDTANDIKSFVMTLYVEVCSQAKDINTKCIHDTTDYISNKASSYLANKEYLKYYTDKLNRLNAKIARVKENLKKENKKSKKK